MFRKDLIEAASNKKVAFTCCDLWQDKHARDSSIYELPLRAELICAN